MYKYPYGNYSQLNLNWIINKIKALEDLIGSGGAGGADLTEMANALISASYSSLQAYQVNDIVYDPKTERLYRCNTAIPAGGEVWNPSHWDQILIGPTVANLVRAVAYMDSDHVFNKSDVDGLHVTEALNALKTAVNSVADIAGNGVLTGFTATDLTGAANELKGALTSVEGDVSDLQGALNTLDDRVKIYQYTGNMPTGLGAVNQVVYTAATMGFSVPSGKTLVLLSASALNSGNNGYYTFTTTIDATFPVCAGIMQNSYISIRINTQTALDAYSGQPVNFVLMVL